ncbi:fructose-2,6-bisphosphatase [Solibacillus daqui]|uniref:fructose-2,6-bisphosphatase n=1 Tax=Solibacillus daqui TaxID=2912187 RepID=UPI002365D7DF|nr:fructose-2,6-bisphosphatase [Solibacillus daqui]
MKKLVFVLLMTVVLAACGTDEKNPTNTGQGNLEESEVIVLYKADSNAEYTMPFEVTFAGNDADFVPFIFENVNKHDVELLDYTFENDNKSLILNLGDDVYSIQGSAGAAMFVETLAKSYFENFSELEEITFIYKGSYESILDHMNIGEPYTRQVFDM